MSFNSRLEHVLNTISENVPYKRMTSRSAEKKINRANVRAAQASGNPSYEMMNKRRNDLLRDIEKKRPLRRSEYIRLYGYNAWRDYVAKHGLPENHPWADADRHGKDNELPRL